MANKIVLVSDDSDFFEYTKLKLELRRSDELFTYSFAELPSQIHQFEDSVIIVNSENSQIKTLELLKIFQGTPIIVMAYNDDENFKKKCYRIGMFDYMTVTTSDSEFRARMISAMTVAGILEKNKQYREFLVNSKIIAKNNDVFGDYEKVLDIELEKLSKTMQKAVICAISPDEKSKFLLRTAQIETILLANLRKNDLLMNYAPNKYFILLFDTDISGAEKLWSKIEPQFEQKIYAGFIKITNQSRQHLINAVLNKLHESINLGKTAKLQTNNFNNVETIKASPLTNFKLFRQEFGKNFENTIIPVFYEINQKYQNKLFDMVIEERVKNGVGLFSIKSKTIIGEFKISAPGFVNINIDISIRKNQDDVDAKRIILEPDEFEKGLLSDLLEQFITELQNTGKGLAGG